MMEGMSQLVRFREIEGIYRPPGLHWVGDGFRVAGYFSAIPDVVQKLDPFLLLDYHPERSNYAAKPVEKVDGPVGPTIGCAKPRPEGFVKLKT